MSKKDGSVVKPLFQSAVRADIVFGMKRIASIDELPDGAHQVIHSGSREFLLVRNGMTVTACGNICPHHGARLSDGAVHQGVVTCPRHHARFDLATGEALSPPAFDPLTVYETDVKEGEVYIGRPAGGGFSPGSYTESPRFVIIGAGAAGISCAETLRGKGFTGQVIVISEEASYPYDRTTLTTSFYSKDDPGLLLRDPEYYEMCGIDIRLNEKVSLVDPAEKTVRCDTGLTISYDRLLVATGATARPLGVDGEDLDGVYRLRSLADAQKIKDSISPASPLLIVGAGFLGLELGFTAASLGVPVTIAGLETRPMENVFGTGYSKRVTRMMEAAGIKWLAGRSVEAFNGEGGLRAVQFIDGTIVKTDAVVVAAGSQPTREIPGLEEMADDPDIFAAGDVISKTGGHWVTAMREGMIAASMMLEETEIPGEVPFFWTEMGKETLRVVGTRPPKVSEPRVEKGSTETGDFLALWRDGKEITGAFSVGYTRELIDIEHLLRTHRR